MYWELVWSAALPGMIFFVVGMGFVILYIKYAEKQMMKVKAQQKKN